MLTQMTPSALGLAVVFVRAVILNVVMGRLRPMTAKSPLYATVDDTPRPQKAKKGDMYFRYVSPSTLSLTELKHVLAVSPETSLIRHADRRNYRLCSLR
jgi:hypothetical protein